MFYKLMYFSDKLIIHIVKNNLLQFLIEMFENVVTNLFKEFESKERSEIYNCALSSSYNNLNGF